MDSVRRFFARFLTTLMATLVGAACYGATSNTHHSLAIIAKLISPHEGVVQNQNTLNVGVHVTLKEGWKTYWRSPGEVGLPPSFNWSGSGNVSKVDVEYPAPVRFEAFGIENYGYDEQVTFPVSVTLKNPGEAAKVNLSAELLLCSEVCIPETFSLTLDLPMQDGVDTLSAKRLAAASARVPDMPAGSAIRLIGADLDLPNKSLVAQFSHDGGFDDPDIFPEMGQTVFGPPKISYEKGGTLLTARYEINFEDGSTDGLYLTLTDGDQAVTYPADDTGSVTSAVPASFVWVLLIAFLGGLILNVMPCVLPVLSIKLASVIQAREDNTTNMRASFLASAAGVITFMMALAAILSIAKSMGHAVGWGVQFQSPYFLTFVIVVLIFFAASMFGLFEFTLSHSINTRLTGHSASGLSGHFLTGAFAALLATPCSAPFLGTAVTFAFTGTLPQMFAIFAMLGIGLALPYLLFAMFPAWVNHLPKPGPWMFKVRYILGILLVLTVLWLLTILWTVGGIYVALAVILVAVIGVIGHSMTLPNPAKMGIAATSLCVALFVPFALKSDAYVERENDRYGISWAVMDRGQIQKLVSDGQVVFVDVTADWCLTCKANKRFVLDSNDIQTALQDETITAMQADWTRADSSITDYLHRNGRFGIPFNIVYGPSASEGIPLPEILTKAAVLDAIEQAR